MVKSYPVFGEKIPITNISDAKSLSVVGESLVTYLSGFMGLAGGLIESFGNTSIDVPKITIVEHTTVKPKLISGEDAAIFTFLLKGDIDNSTSLNVGGRQYSVIHNGIAYPFSFADDASKFDLAENSQTRQQILESIHFTN